jgi:carboxylesterase type B
MPQPVLIGNTENEMATFLRGTNGALMKLPGAGRTLSNVFSCPAGDVAKGRSAYVPVWRYSYAGDYPNQVMGPEVSGPYHGSEIGLVYGTNGFTKKLPNTPEQTALSKKMRDAWLAFAKDPEKGLEGIWPKYDPTSKSIEIGINQNS